MCCNVFNSPSSSVRESQCSLLHTVQQKSSSFPPVCNATGGGAGSPQTLPGSFLPSSAPAPLLDQTQQRTGLLLYVVQRVSKGLRVVGTKARRMQNAKSGEKSFFRYVVVLREGKGRLESKLSIPFFLDRKRRRYLCLGFKKLSPKNGSKNRSSL